MKKNLSFITLIGLLLLSVSVMGQYCTSEYENAQGTSWQNFISKVAFNTIYNTSGPSNYTDFTGINTHLHVEGQYELVVTISIAPSSTMHVMAWIDWNQDFDFDDVGESYSLGSVNGPTVGFGTEVTASIVVPAGADLGSTRMRISAKRGTVAPGPCIDPQDNFGETEDYSVTINPIPIYFYWDGSENEEWDNALNWADGIVPTVVNPVIIQGGAPHYPNVDGLFVGACYGANCCESLVIEDGASLNYNGVGYIRLYGDITVNSGGSLNCNRIKVGYGGTLSINGGTVTVNNECLFVMPDEGFGSGNMSSGTLFVGGVLNFGQFTAWEANGGSIVCMSGTDTEIINASNDLTLYSLVIESGATAHLSGSSTARIFIDGDFVIEPNAEFTMEAPNFSSNVSKINVSQSSTIIEGSSSGKGSFIQEDGALLITNEVTVESYYTAGRWHFISSPVTFAVSGVFLDLYLKAFDEPTNTYTAEPGIISTTYPLGVGQGFEMYSTIGSQSISYIIGQLNTGDLSTTFTATDSNSDLLIGDGEGWNLIGNPYPSAIDVGTENDQVAGYTWTNIDNTIYAWNGTAWSSFNMAGDGTGINGGTRYLPTMQGFFLKANDFNPAFGFANSARLHSSQANYKSSVNDDFEIRLVVSGNGYSDEMIVRAINTSTELFDSKYDAYKLPGLDEVPQLYTKAGSSLLSINTLPEFTEESVVPVCVKVNNSGIYTIDANDFDLSEIGLTAYLEDIKEESFIILDENTLYEFSSSPNDNEHRFNLIFKDAESNDDLVSSSIQIFSYDDKVQIRKEFGVSSDIYIYDIMGREVISKSNNMDNKLELQVLNGTGYYLVKVVTNSEIQTEKVFISNYL